MVVIIDTKSKTDSYIEEGKRRIPIQKEISQSCLL